MKPMQSNNSIVFLGTQMEVAGAQRMLLSQARWFQKKGFVVQAVFFYDKQGLSEGWQAANTFPVISLEARMPNANPFSNAGRLMRAFWRLFRLLKNNQVIITFTPHSNLLGLPIAWLAGVSVRIGTHHGYIEGSSKLLAWFHGRLSNSKICSKMVAVSNQVKEYAIMREHVNPEKIIVIQNGIEPHRLVKEQATMRQVLRNQFHVAESDLLVVTVGRFTVQKGHTFLIDAISQIAPRYPKVHFVFAGDGPLRQELEGKVKSLGLITRITFPGIRNDINELLLASDIFVQPSLWEGLSLALLEALMAGLPVLATQVEGVADVVVDGKSALFVPPGDSERLAAALEKLMQDPELRSKLSKQGRERAEKSYSIDSMCNYYFQLIRNLLPDAS